MKSIHENAPAQDLSEVLEQEERAHPGFRNMVEEAAERRTLRRLWRWLNPWNPYGPSSPEPVCEGPGAAALTPREARLVWDALGFARRYRAGFIEESHRTAYSDYTEDEIHDLEGKFHDER